MPAVDPIAPGLYRPRHCPARRGRRLPARRRPGLGRRHGAPAPLHAEALRRLQTRAQAPPDGLQPRRLGPRPGGDLLLPWPGDARRPHYWCGIEIDFRTRLTRCTRERSVSLAAPCAASSSPTSGRGVLSPDIYDPTLNPFCRPARPIRRRRAVPHPRPRSERQRRSQPRPEDRCVASAWSVSTTVRRI